METILVPTDFSPAAKNAAHYAVGLAKFFNSKLILLNAYPVPSANLDTMFPVEVVTSMQSIATKNLDDFKSELLAANGNELDIECLTEMGSAFDVINSTCKKHAIDLIVMGIVSEAGTIKEHIIGSSAVTVARYIEIPTFIIPQGIKYNPVHHISFACDMEKKEKTALINIVKYFGQIFDAQIDVINVEKPAEEVSYEKAQTSVFIEKKLESLSHKTVYITKNKIAKGLEDYLKSHPTDLLILNPKKHNIFHVMFKENVTNELAFHLHLPMLAIH